MNVAFDWAIANIAIASVLALGATIVGQLFHRPALTHGLWVLVLLKLITPPLVSAPLLPAPVIEEVEWERAPAIWRPIEEPGLRWHVGAFPPPIPVDVPQPINVIPRESEEVVLPAEPAPIPVRWSWQAFAMGVWLLGMAVWFLLAGFRLAKFGWLLRQALPAPREWLDEARRLADHLEVECPRVVFAPGLISPMLWGFTSKPLLVLPASLLTRLSAEQIQTLLVHELAHLKRRDHWVRWLELIVLGVYWWCPLAWWARAELQKSEEECCDAWVVWALPESAKAYALALVETLDFLSEATSQTMVPTPPLASGLGQVLFLRRRVTMILRGARPKALTLAGVAALLVLGIGLLPIRISQAQAQEGEAKKRPNAAKPIEDAEVQKAMAELQELRKQLEKREHELRDLMQKKGVARPGIPFNRPGFGPGGPPHDVERRLAEIERKLDRLLAMAHGPQGGTGVTPPPLGDGQRTPGAGLGRKPGGPDGAPLPLRRGDADPRPAPQGDQPAPSRAPRP